MYRIELAGTETRTAPTVGTAWDCYGLYPRIIPLGNTQEFLSGDSAQTGRKALELQPRLEEFRFPEDMTVFYAVQNALTSRFLYVKIITYEAGALPVAVPTNTWLKAVMSDMSVEHDDDTATKKISFKMRIIS